MKILFFIDGLAAGGKERRLVELMKGLKLNPEIEFQIVVMNEEIHYKQLYELDININYLIRQSKKDLSVFLKFYRICKNYKPDIVHCWDSMTAVIAVPSCKLLHIFLINGMVVDAPIKRNVFNKHWLRAKLSFPFSNRIVGNSKAGLVAYSACASKSVCIYNGIDFNRFKNLPDPSIFYEQILDEYSNQQFIAGMVATFDSRKDYKTFIKAALSLIAANDFVRIILVGSGTNLMEIQNSVPSSIKDKIIFLGKRNDVESIINLFDVGILLTNSKVHGEGISNSIIEYMALGKPVIATRGGGTNEVVIDKENGFLVNPGDSNQLVGCVQKLINDKKLRSKLGLNAKKTAYNKFDLKIMTKNYISMYQHLLQENKN